MPNKTIINVNAQVCLTVDLREQCSELYATDM